MFKSFGSRPAKRHGAVQKRLETVIFVKALEVKKEKRINKAKNAPTKNNKVPSQNKPVGKKGTTGPKSSGKGSGSKGPITNNPQ